MKKSRNVPGYGRQTPSRLRSAERLIGDRRGELEKLFVLLSGVPLTRREIRKMIKEVLKDEETERHMLGQYGCDSWEEAMRAEDNFYAFLSDITEIEKQLSRSRFAEILKIAATSSRGHAQFFLDSARDLKQEIQNRKVLEEALAAAREFLRRRRK